jgi:NAD(P)-dependent dehydrogenase (short-subunit alcohol dehydrogenase family)
MNLQLEGKRALVTGSTAGIGFAIAEALANEGARVIINGRTRKRVDEALSKLKGDVEGVAADLGTAEGAVEVAARYPEVDILINNLGIFEPKPLAKSPTTTGGGFLK